MESGILQDYREAALHYFKTLVDVARESFLILDPDLRVISANPVFYQKFQSEPAETEGRLLYELGNGQWNVPKLRDLLEKVLPEKKTVRDYEVSHVFEKIGQKTMLLNARQIDSVQLIILAIEDITFRAEYTKDLEAKVVEQTKGLADRIKELETVNKSMVGRELMMIELKKEIESLKKLTKNGNGKNGKNGNHKGR